MKTFTLFSALILMFYSATAQEITGKWNGLLKVPGAELTVVINIDTDESGGYKATMDSPDQGAFGIPVNSVTFVDNQLVFEVSALNVVYKGEYGDNIIKGTFSQAGFDFPLDLSTEAVKKTQLVRPQQPKEPYPYHSEEVIFTNLKAGIKLAGTLTLPKKSEKFPAVILISGSGPQNRDEELFGHKPFLVIADHLTRNGIAVLRFDDRGVNASEGDHDLATSADFATDVESAVAYLKTRAEINHKKIGLMGHSEGGLIAPMVAANDKSIAFIVLLAGPGMIGKELLPLQMELISKASGMNNNDIKKTAIINNEIFSMINTSDDQTLLSEKIINYMKNIPDNLKPGDWPSDEIINMQVKQFTSPWMRYFLNYDPLPTLTKVTCPVLALNGEKDLQVPPKENLSGIEKTLKEAGNKQVTVIEFKGLNHLFQECETGSPMEYGNIEQTFSPLALKPITSWLLEKSK